MALDAPAASAETGSRDQASGSSDLGKDIASDGAADAAQAWDTSAGGSRGSGGAPGTGAALGTGGYPGSGGMGGRGGFDAGTDAPAATGGIAIGGTRGTGGVHSRGGASGTGGWQGSGGAAGGSGGTTCGGPAGITCPSGQLCDLASSCGVIVDAVGICVATGSGVTCPATYAPVCGCDGQTYANDCARQAAGVLKASSGACPVGSGGVPGTGGASGTGGALGSGGAPGAGGTTVAGTGGSCQKGQVGAGEVVIMGDNLYAKDPQYVQKRIEENARAAGALGAMESYRNVAANGQPMNYIVATEWTSASQSTTKVVIMNGGVIDCMTSSCPTCPDKFETLLTQMVSHGVQDVIYTRYPEPGNPPGSSTTLKNNLDILMPELQVVCEAAVGLRCHWVDLRPVWINGDTSDGVHPTESGGRHVGDAIWARMVEECIAQ